MEFRLKAVCGCGQRWETDRAEYVLGVIKAAKTHAEVKHHSLEIRGGIQVDKQRILPSESSGRTERRV
jgi:hypothetical protein